MDGCHANTQHCTILSLPLCIARHFCCQKLLKCSRVHLEGFLIGLYKKCLYADLFD